MNFMRNGVLGKMIVFLGVKVEVGSLEVGGSEQSVVGGMVLVSADHDI